MVFSSSLAICGTITRTVTGATSPITYLTGTQILEIYSTNNALKGTTFPVKVKTFLTDYTSITGADMTINVQIPNCSPTSLTATTSLVDKIYTIS